MGRGGNANVLDIAERSAPTDLLDDLPSEPKYSIIKVEWDESRKMPALNMVTMDDKTQIAGKFRVLRGKHKDEEVLLLIEVYPKKALYKNACEKLLGLSATDAEPVDLLNALADTPLSVKLGFKHSSKDQWKIEKWLMVKSFNGLSS
jgi:hypothetical protein